MTRSFLAVFCVLVALLATQAPVAAQTPLAAAQDDDESEEGESSEESECVEPVSIQTVRGTIIETEELELFEGDDHLRVVLLLDDGNDDPEDDMELDFLVFGKGELLELGSDYRVTVSQLPSTGLATFESRAAFLGTDLMCSAESSIEEVLDDGSTVPIDVSGFDLPSVPVTPRQVAIGFGALAVLTFLFREPRTAH